MTRNELIVTSAGPGSPLPEARVTCPRGRLPPSPTPGHVRATLGRERPQHGQGPFAHPLQLNQPDPPGRSHPTQPGSQLTQRPHLLLHGINRFEVGHQRLHPDPNQPKPPFEVRLGPYPRDRLGPYPRGRWGPQPRERAIAFEQGGELGGTESVGGEVGPGKGMGGEAAGAASGGAARAPLGRPDGRVGPGRSARRRSAGGPTHPLTGADLAPYRRRAAELALLLQSDRPGLPLERRLGLLRVGVEALVADLESVDAVEEELRPLRDLVADLDLLDARTGPTPTTLERLRDRALAVLRAFGAPGDPATPGRRDPTFWRR